MVDSKEKDELLQHDWYGILGCDVGSSREIIEKAARKLAIKYHPDKTSDPEAPAKFLLIQKAKEILTDEDKKHIIDDHLMTIKKRQEYDSVRNKNMDESRKRFRDSLDKKIEGERNKSQRSLDPDEILEQEIRKRTKIIEEVRRKNVDTVELAREEARRRMEKKLDDFQQYSSQVAEEKGDKQCQIKVKWRRNTENHSDESLYELFKVFGAIEDATVNRTKGSSGVVTFVSPIFAQLAVDHYATSEDYRVSFAFSEKSKQKAAIFTHNFSNSESLNRNIAEEVERFVEQQSEISDPYFNILANKITESELVSKENEIFSQIMKVGLL